MGSYINLQGGFDMLTNAEFHLVLCNFGIDPGMAFEIVSGEVEISENDKHFYGNGMFVGIECTIEGKIDESHVIVSVVVRAGCPDDKENWIFYGLNFTIELSNPERPFIGLIGKWNLVEDESKAYPFNSSGFAICALANPLHQR